MDARSVVTCPACGAENRADDFFCRQCKPNLHGPSESVTPPASPHTGGQSASDASGATSPGRTGGWTDSAPITVAQASTEAGNGQLCIFLGIIFLAVGLYFLVVNPSSSDAAVLGTRVATCNF